MTCFETTKSLVWRIQTKNIRDIFSAVVLCIQFESAVYSTIFMIAGYLSVEVLIDTKFLSRHVNFIRSIGRQVEFTKGKRPLLEDAQDEFLVEN